MKTKRIQDERVTAQKRKITSEAYSYVMIFLLGSVLVKQFVFHAEFSEYAIEFIAFFGSSFYIVIRNLLVGNHLFSMDNNKGKIILNTLVTSSTITVVLAFMNMGERGSRSEFMIQMVIVFVIAGLASLVSNYGLYKLNQRRIEKLEKHYDEDEKEQ